MTTAVPISDIDVYSDEVLVDPYPAYHALRDAGPAVRLSGRPLWVIAHYDDARAALADAATFSSAAGVGVSDEMNAMQAGTVLASDDPQHAELRSVLSEKLAPRALNRLRADIAERADALVVDVIARGEFDGVADLAARLPADVVADLIGLPHDGREVLLPGADAMFATFGPLDDRLRARMPEVMAYTEYMSSHDRPRPTRPGRLGCGDPRRRRRGAAPARIGGPPYDGLPHRLHGHHRALARQLPPPAG